MYTEQMTVVTNMRNMWIDSSMSHCTSLKMNQSSDGCFKRCKLLFLSNHYIFNCYILRLLDLSLLHLCPIASLHFFHSASWSFCGRSIANFAIVIRFISCILVWSNVPGVFLAITSSPKKQYNAR